MVEVKLAPIVINDRSFEAEIGTIKSTMLGIEDHGWLTFMLHLNFVGSGQGAGSYMLDCWDKDKNKNMPLLWTGAIIRRILEVVGVDEWERLQGRTVVALRDKPWDIIRGLMSAPPAEPKYVIFEDLFEEFKP